MPNPYRAVTDKSEISGSRIIDELVTAKNNLALIDTPDHPVLIDCLESLHLILTAYMSTNGPAEFYLRDSELFLGDQCLARESLLFYPLIEILANQGVSGFILKPGLSIEELRIFLNLLNIEDGFVCQPFDAELERLQHIQVLIGSEPGDVVSGNPDTNRDTASQKMSDIYLECCAQTQQIFKYARKSSSIQAHKAKEASGLIAARAISGDPDLLKMTLYKGSAEQIIEHSVRVCLLAAAFSVHAGFSKEQTHTIALAALLHDIGFVKVPTYVTEKCEILGEHEERELRKHPIHGAVILSHLEGVSRIATIVAYEHHAGFNLTGYPRVTGVHRPHIFSRIVQIADYFESSTNGSLSQNPIAPSSAINTLLREAGMYYDPIVARMFIRMTGVYPIGSFIRLSDGSVCVVARNDTADIFKPKVIITRDENGDAPKDFPQISISEDRFIVGFADEDKDAPALETIFGQ